ncbi:MAG: helix-turn-helix domain-containing protein [Coriobacteriia bacterium]|nr:helix-turn-helix domain-containing protein [Coriobacteriia bacterium]
MKSINENTDEEITALRRGVSLRLRTARESKGLTQLEMGHFLNLTAQGYAKYEKGADVKSHILLQLCAILQCSPSWLLGFKEVGANLPPESKLLQELIEIYEILNKKGHQRLIEYARDLKNHHHYSFSTELSSNDRKDT